jgi:hypothetical protein
MFRLLRSGAIEDNVGSNIENQLDESGISANFTSLHCRSLSDATPLNSQSVWYARCSDERIFGQTLIFGHVTRHSQTEANIMGTHLSATAESSQTVVVSGKQKEFVFDGATLERDQVPEATGLERTESKLREMQDIARSEMSRRRRRLGNLTPDQEMAVEKLLSSTVSRILEIVVALEL